MNNQQMDLYNHEWEQFIHAGSDGSFTDWLVRRMDHIATVFEERLEKVESRLNRVQRTTLPQERIEILQRENQSLRQQLEFERQGRHEPAPAVGQPRPERWVTGPDQTNAGSYPDPRRRPDPLWEQERRERIRRLAERIQALPQDSDSG